MECHTKDHSPPLAPRGIVTNAKPQNMDSQIDAQKRDQLGADMPFLY